MKKRVTIGGLKKLYSDDKSGLTQLLEISFWHDQKKEVGHIFGAIVRGPERYFFEPQIMNEGQSPYVKIDDYSEHDLHYIVLDQWQQPFEIEPSCNIASSKKIKLDPSLDSSVKIGRILRS